MVPHSTIQAAEFRDVVLVVHAGAGVVGREECDPAMQDEAQRQLQAALQAGYAVLASNSFTSLDAVGAAVRVMEDSPVFNAGKGAALTADGTAELDSAIMSGLDLHAGAVANVTTLKNPITAARLVMEQSRHVLMAGNGAEKFAIQHGAETVDPSYFITPQRLRSLEAKLREVSATLQSNAPAPAQPYDRFGTVGAVALDSAGNLAAGTSTGGITGKRPGRVGDTPLIGAGTYADNRSCAVSCTGDGEIFIRTVAARTMAALVEYRSLSLVEAVTEFLTNHLAPLGGQGGAILLNQAGEAAIAFNSPAMYRGVLWKNGKTLVVDGLGRVASD
ncbi:MAG: isoaspartyl peptidase/L-asparaginase [Planctomycetota bacterium]|nr:isoaspartyl peptidase/L-asparaginase [Planctomycetota bacterium]